MSPGKPPAAPQVREVVLPDGRFARFTPPLLWIHLIAAHDLNSAAMVARLAAQVVTLDGQKFPYEHYVAMEVETFLPIQAMLGEALKAINFGAKGVA